MSVGTLKPDEADQNVVEAARLLVGRMIRSRPYMMVLEDGVQPTVVGHFHTLHDVRLHARRNDLQAYSVWIKISTSQGPAPAETLGGQEEYEPAYDAAYEQEYEEQEEELLDSETETEQEYIEDEPPVLEDMEDLLSTDLPDLEEGEELDEDEGVL